MALLFISNIIIIQRNISQMRRTIFVPTKNFDVLMVFASTKNSNVIRKSTVEIIRTNLRLTLDVKVSEEVISVEDGIGHLFH